MIRIKTVVKKSQKSFRGIHLYRPTKKQIEDALDRARSQGFKTIWIHKKKVF
jgi:hypothetical protein